MVDPQQVQRAADVVLFSHALRCLSPRLMPVAAHPIEGQTAPGGPLVPAQLPDSGQRLVPVVTDAPPGRRYLVGLRQGLVPAAPMPLQSPPSTFNHRPKGHGAGGVSDDFVPAGC